MTAAAAVTAQVDFWSCCPRAPQWRPYRFRVENLATLKENVLTERGHRAVPSKVHTAHFFVPWARDLIARGRTHHGSSLKRQHAADQCLPSDRTDNPVHDDRWNVQRQSVLEASDGTVGLWSEDSIHFESFTGFASTELELLLDAADCVARAAFFHLNYESRPRLGTHYPISCHALAGLKCFDSSFRNRAKHSVDREIVTMRAEQKLKGSYRMSLVAVLRDWPRAECAGHEMLLPYMTDYGTTSSTSATPAYAVTRPANFA